MIRTPLTLPARRWRAGFVRREDGAITILGLVMFSLMILGGGMALDIMRSETRRAEMQNTVDRAVLAAAGLDQTRSGEEIVRDYLRAAGLDEEAVTVTSVENASERLITAEINARTESLFLRFLGVDELMQPISAQAREVRIELELSLVVDISGSMGGKKIAALRTAASEFVAELLRDRAHLTTVSLIPYNDRVNAGHLVEEYFPFSNEHRVSRCAVFEPADFLRTGLDPNERLQRMGHFDPSTHHRAGNATGLVDDPNCLTDDFGAVLPWSSDVAELQTRIDGLVAGGSTAIDLGVKWGALLLDPTSADELEAMASDGHVDGGFVGRPNRFDAPGVHKVLVVMTDGLNVKQWDLEKDRLSGPSRVYVHVEPTSDFTVDWGTDALVIDDSTSPPTGEVADGRNVVIDAGLGTVDLALSEIGTTIGQTYANGRRNGMGGVNYNSQGRTNEYAFDGEPGSEVYYSFWSIKNGSYYIPHLDEFHAQPFGGADAVQLDWAELYGALSLRYIGNELLKDAPWLDRSYYANVRRTTYDYDSADVNLSAICKAARDQGVLIYTISFQAPTRGQDAMRDCAGTENPSRYSDVEGLNISSAFDDVLAAVSKLRLTQ